jgi:hypothetical protein
MSDLEEMGPAQLRALIDAATTRLVLLEPRWYVHLHRARKVREYRLVTVEAASAEAAVAAAIATKARLNEDPDEWEPQDGADEVLSFEADSNLCDTDLDPDYRIGGGGQLEEWSGP